MSAPNHQLTRFDGLRRAALSAGGAGILLSVLGLLLNPTNFFRSYLFAYVYWIAFPLGSMALLMMHHLTGGGWGLLIRRVLEAGSRTLWLLAVLYLPLLAGISHLYLWAQNAGGSSAEVAQKHFYLNVPFFLLRSAFYFLVWLGLMGLLNRWSLEQDRTGDQRFTHRLAALSGPGLLLYGLTITFAAIDWVMSLEPSWFSTIYGLVYIVAQALVAMAFVILVARRLSQEQPLATIATPTRFIDLGNLLLTFVMLWAYLCFSQFLIIWSGNLPDEISWYMSRARGGWAALAVALILFHFAVPFFLLLSRDIKRHRGLAVVAWLLLLLTLVDFYWLIVPAFYPAAPHLNWTDFTLWIAMGGLWLWLFFTELGRRALVPQHDPGYIEVLQHARENAQ